jgi:hypothetical protein
MAPGLPAARLVSPRCTACYSGFLGGTALTNPARYSPIVPFVFGHALVMTKCDWWSTDFGWGLFAIKDCTNRDDFWLSAALSGERPCKS